MVHIRMYDKQTSYRMAIANQLGIAANGFSIGTPEEIERDRQEDCRSRKYELIEKFADAFIKAAELGRRVEAHSVSAAEYNNAFNDMIERLCSCADEEEEGILSSFAETTGSEAFVEFVRLELKAQ